MRWMCHVEILPESPSAAARETVYRFRIDRMSREKRRQSIRSVFGVTSDSTIPLYLGFSFFQDLALIYPVYMIYFEQTGLDYLRMSWLLAIWGVPVLLMELPSGIVADLWSRKWSLVVGMLFKASGFCVWLIRPDFAGFALGFVLWGVQEGICTGVSEALLYDALLSRDEEDRFTEISGWGGMLRRLAIIISVLLGGVLFSVSVAAVLITSAAAMVVAAGCAALFRERSPSSVSCDIETGSGTGARSGQVGGAASETRAPGESETPAGAGSSGFAAIRCALGNTLRGTAFIPLMLFGALATVVYGVLDEYDFLFGREYGVPLALIGVWGGFRFLMEALGALFAHRFEKWMHLDSPDRLAVWMIGAGFMLVPVAVIGSVYLLPLYFLFFFAMAVAELVFQAWIQRRVMSSGRATVLSLVSLVYEVFGLLLVLAAGPLSSRHGLEGLFLGGGIAVSVAAILFGISVQYAQRWVRTQEDVS